MTDSLIRALQSANPVSPEDFTDLPPLRPSRRRRAALATLVALAVVTLTPSAPPAGAEIARRALGTAPGEILHWRVRVETPRMAPYTEELWMRADRAGRVTAVRELRTSGDYAGDETLTLQPHGLGNLAGTVSYRRTSAHAPVKVARGVGYGEGFASAVQTALQAARGQLDLGRARETGDAYEVQLQDAIGEQPAITLRVDRATHRPLAVRWGGWRTETILAFERLPGDPDLTRLRRVR
jgi:hypothetical protein